MKHPVIIIVINLILIVVLVGLLLGAGFIEEINDVSISFNGISFGINSDAEYMADDSYERGEGSANASEVTSLDIAWLAGEVKFLPTDGDTITIRESSDEKLEDNEVMRWKVEDGRLSIRYATKSKLFDNMPEKKLTIEIPASDWQIENVEIQTVSANVKLSVLNAKKFGFDSVSGLLDADSLIGESIDVNGMSGEINVNKLECETLSIDGVSGKISIKEGNVAKSMNVSTVSGNLEFDGIVRSVEWDTTSGNAKFDCTASPSNIEADTTSGDVTITLPADIGGFRAEMDSVSGELKSDFDISREDDFARYGDESIEIEMDSTSGNLRIRKAS